MFAVDVHVEPEIANGTVNLFINTTEGKEYVFKTVIPRNIRLAEAPSYGKPCIVYDPESKGAIAYLKLAKEILERDGK